MNRPASLSLPLAALLFFSAAGAARATNYDVYLLAGQSNMDGRGLTSDLTGSLASYAAPDPGVELYYDNPAAPASYTPGWVPLQPGYSVPSSTLASVPSGDFGPELGFGHAMQANEPAGSTVALIKVSDGGTSLVTDWNPSNPNGLFDLLISDAQSAMASLATPGNTVTLKGMIWHQGESDASESEHQYQDELVNFINSVRTSLSDPTMPFVIGEVYDNGARDSIIEAQEAVAAIPGYDTGFASSAGLVTSDNGTHFDASSQILLGQRFAASMQALLVPEPGGVAGLALAALVLHRRKLPCIALEE